MNTYKKRIQRMFVLMAAVMMMCCLGTMKGQAAEEVALSKTKVTVYEGKGCTLTLRGAEQPITWSSSKKSIAAVGKTGKVTAKKPGTAVITAKYKGKKYKCKVTVPKPAISKKKITLQVGKKATLSVKRTKKAVTWKSTNTKVAKVTKKGVVTAAAVGSASIVAKANGKKYTCKVTVEEAKTTGTPVVISTKYKELKNYITKKGSVNTTGDKFIRIGRMRTEKEDVFAAVYNKAEDSITFSAIFEENNTKSSMQMKIRKRNKGLQAEYLVLLTTDIAYGKAVAYLDMSQYNGKSSVLFTTTEQVKMTSAEVNKLANTYIKIAFKGWETLLNDNVHISLRDLGFSNCKVKRYNDIHV